MLYYNTVLTGPLILCDGTIPYNLSKITSNHVVNVFKLYLELASPGL